ncbi:DUF742 domain-containing protein [Actinomadura viridis]|uniref:DUF742 domain-containing protein n=1 Tax=Actinomadura viridis TaxID=58110 RepID=UPI0036878B73
MPDIDRAAPQPEQPPELASGLALGDPDEQVRPYALTGGRTRPRHAMRMESLLEIGGIPAPTGLPPEADHAVALCRAGRCSVAEIAARLGQPVQVTKIILSDLIDSGALALAVPGTTSGDRVQLLEAVLAGLQKRFSDAA